MRVVLSAKWYHTAPKVPGQSVLDPRCLRGATVRLESREEAHFVSHAQAQSATLAWRVRGTRLLLDLDEMPS